MFFPNMWGFTYLLSFLYINYKTYGKKHYSQLVFLFETYTSWLLKNHHVLRNLYLFGAASNYLARIFTAKTSQSALNCDKNLCLGTIIVYKTPIYFCKDLQYSLTTIKQPLICCSYTRSKFTSCKMGIYV